MAEQQQKQRAVVLGATGLVGTALLQQLLADGERFSEVRVLGRRACGVTHPRLREWVVDFERPETWGEAVAGDVLFSVLGTTRRRAGGKAAQYRVDFTYQQQVAAAAAQAGCVRLVLVSSMGADARSWMFYSRMKGELDAAVQRLSFAQVTILRPSLLEGERTEARLGEGVALQASRALGGLLGAYRHIAAGDVARAMRAAAVAPYTAAERVRVVEGEGVHALAAALG